MHLIVATLLLGVAAISAEDLGDLYLSSVTSETRPFKLFSQFSVGSDMDHLLEMAIYMSEQGSKDSSRFLAGVTKDGVDKGEDGDKIKTGYILDITKKVKFEITWKPIDEGYCRVYTSKVIGVDVNGQTRSVSRKVTVGPRLGSSCTKKKEPESTIEIPDKVKDAFPDLTQQQQEQILEKLNSIDDNTYDVSSIYKGRIYIATMDDTNFELPKMNELCKSAGGYLVEFDDAEEEWFVRDFLRSLGSFHYFTGANDVESEGNFVFYNSKKPVTNVVWKKGEPNNGGGHENCVELSKKGLNDKTCTKRRGYICEVPLSEERPNA